MNESTFVNVPKKLRDCLRTVSSVVVMTGAGISAESGIPTFREAQTGLWAQYRPEDLATPQAFARNPELVWQWYKWRRGLVTQANPNEGHLALSSFASKYPNFTLITQNVDGLHQKAGSKNVLELHGNLHRYKCFENHHVAQPFDWKAAELPPSCDACNSILRPDVVWFGEGLPPRVLDQAIRAVENCEVFFSIGTSSVVYPAADLAFQAVRKGAVTVEVNPSSTPASEVFNYCLRGGAGTVLPQLLKAI